MKHHLSVKAAAARVKRSPRTIERWIEAGDLEVTAVTDERGRVLQGFVRLDQLLAVYRAKIVANPTRTRTPDDVVPP